MAGLRRRIAGVPGDASAAGPFDGRWTGSAAIECAFVAAGLMGAARFRSTNIWDVAGGVALVQAAGGHVLERQSDGWTRFERFGRDGDPAGWRGALVIAGTAEAADALAAVD
jgi:myo-inositol-1(or 4)-monophosphatase